MNEGQSLAQTLAARMQLGLLGTANTIAHSVRVGRGIADNLKQRKNAFEHLLLSPGHDSQVARLRPDLPA